MNMDTATMKQLGCTEEAQLQLGELSEEFAAYKAEWRQRVVDMQAEMAEFLENLKTR